jgi:hypothetical protein
VAKLKVARGGSKTARILDLLKRPGGATSKELMKATGWSLHSVRGWLQPWALALFRNCYPIPYSPRRQRTQSAPSLDSRDSRRNTYFC